MLLKLAAVEKTGFTDLPCIIFVKSAFFSTEPLPQQNTNNLTAYDRLGGKFGKE